MLFPDLVLARRLEFHEAWSAVQHARVQARLYPETGAVSLPAAGGHAVFCGARSPLNQVYGLGLAGPVHASDLDVVETFYASRDQVTTVRLCSLTDTALLRLLGERGYRAQAFMNVYARPVVTANGASSDACGLSIRVATPGEARQWFERSGAQGDWAEPDGVSFMTIRCVLKPGVRLFIAWRDGQPVGGGALEVHDGVAALMAAETLPSVRRQGIHTALVRARLAAAAEAGCDVALVHTRPGASSQRNVLRAGFQLAYTVVELVSSSEEAHR